jgi:flagellar biosynthesis/type III secretory pathway protein FliH
MLGKAESAKLAFADIIKLDPNLELRNDIIEVSLKHCIYLEEFQQELTEEDLSFMTYVKDVEAAYQRWVEKNKSEGKIEGKLEGKIEGKIELVNKMVRAKFGVDALTAAVQDRLEGLNNPQLDEFTTKIFEWQQPSEMITWLENT